MKTAEREKARKRESSLSVLMRNLKLVIFALLIFPHLALRTVQNAEILTNFHSLSCLRFKNLINSVGCESLNILMSFTHFEEKTLQSWKLWCLIMWSLMQYVNGVKALREKWNCRSEVEVLSLCEHWEVIQHFFIKTLMTWVDAWWKLLLRKTEAFNFSLIAMCQNHNEHLFRWWLMT